jgi:hypothetical protein
MTTLDRPVAECTQFYIDPDEERHNELMTEENWEILKKLPNSIRLVVDNTAPVAGVATAQQLTDLRLRLQANGYHPVPVIGKAVKMPAWQTRCLSATPQQISNWSYSQSDCKSTGILCGQTVGVDIDVLDERISSMLAACAARMLGPTSLRRIGKAPKTLLMYRVETPHDKQQTPELLIGDVKARVEILAKGQQFVAFGIHPGTNAPYNWPEQSPLDIPVADVPLVTLESLSPVDGRSGKSKTRSRNRNNKAMPRLKFETTKNRATRR